MDFSKLSKSELQALCELIYNELKTSEELSEKNSLNFSENAHIRYVYQTNYLKIKIKNVLDYFKYLEK